MKMLQKYFENDKDFGIQNGEKLPLSTGIRKCCPCDICRCPINLPGYE